RKPPGSIAAARGSPLQVVFPAGQHQAGGQRPNFDLRKGKRPHRLTVRILPPIAFQNRACPTSNNLAADESSLRRVLVIGRERDQVAAIPSPLGFLEHRANLVALRKQQRRPGKHRQPTHHALYYTEPRAYWIEQASDRLCALDPSAPTPSNNSSNVCSGTGLPLLPTLGITAHLSAALKEKRGSDPSSFKAPVGGVTSCPIGMQRSG